MENKNKNVDELEREGKREKTSGRKEHKQDEKRRETGGKEEKSS